MIPRNIKKRSPVFPGGTFFEPDFGKIRRLTDFHSDVWRIFIPTIGEVCSAASFIKKVLTSDHSVTIMEASKTNGG